MNPIATKPANPTEPRRHGERAQYIWISPRIGRSPELFAFAERLGVSPVEAIGTIVQGYNENDSVREFINATPRLVRWGPTEYRRVKIPRWLRERVLREGEYRCAQCGYHGYGLEIDHIHPVSRGGKNDYENLQALCKPCNLKKRAHLPEGSVA